jgi:predicted DNA-binding transcriptional regulator YafY
MERLKGCRYAPSLATLAREFHVSTRTMRRDFEALEAAGVTLPKWRVKDDIELPTGRGGLAWRFLEQGME